MENSIHIKQCEKLEQFLRKYSDIETDRYLVNVYLMQGEDLEQQIEEISQYFEEKNQGILNLFIEEESECKKNIMNRKVFSEVIEHYVTCADGAELLVEKFKLVSKDRVEIKTIRYLFSKYTDWGVFVDAEEIGYNKLDKIIKEVCDNPKKYTYSEFVGGKRVYTNNNLQDKILCYKARFDYIWFYYKSQQKRIMKTYSIEGL